MPIGLRYALLVATLVAAQAVASNGGWAGEHRQHEAHEHGIAHLNVAVEGSTLSIEFTSPAANIVGFEHRPRNQAQRDQVAEAKKQLEAGQTLFQPPAQAQARLVKAMVDTDIDRDSDDTPHHHEDAGGHDADEESGHQHHDQGHGHAGHSDFTAHYQFICEDPEKLNHLDVMLLRMFPGIERLAVQVLTDAGQSATTITANDYRITF